MFVNKTAILEMFKKLISRIFFIRPGYTTSFAGATVFRVVEGGGVEEGICFSKLTQIAENWPFSVLFILRGGGLATYMVLILEGISEIGVHRRSNLCCLICLRRLINRDQSQIGFFYFPSCGRNMF